LPLSEKGRESRDASSKGKRNVRGSRGTGELDPSAHREGGPSTGKKIRTNKRGGGTKSFLPLGGKMVLPRRGKTERSAPKMPKARGILAKGHRAKQRLFQERIGFFGIRGGEEKVFPPRGKKLRMGKKGRARRPSLRSKIEVFTIIKAFTGPGKSKIELIDRRGRVLKPQSCSGERNYPQISRLDGGKGRELNYLEKKERQNTFPSREKGTLGEARISGRKSPLGDRKSPAPGGVHRVDLYAAGARDSVEGEVISRCQKKRGLYIEKNCQKHRTEKQGKGHHPHVSHGVRAS